jgi:hypothetical protein
MTDTRAAAHRAPTATAFLAARLAPSPVPETPTGVGRP